MANPTPSRLLVVDDVEDNREILTRRFTRLGYEVVQAHDGQQALDAIAREAFDAVLCDIMMPVMDGLEVLRRVRETRTQAQLPVIMVSAKAASEDVVEALLLGANDYVTKPVDLKVAQARIEAQIARKRQEDIATAARGDLELALERLRDQLSGEAAVRASSDHGERLAFGHALGAAGVVARLCESPELRTTIDVIEGAVGALQSLAVPSPPTAAPAEVRDEPAHGRIRILSADGAAKDRQVVRMMLAEAEAGVKLLEVSDGAEAVAAAAAQPFDLIVIGLQMPGMDGPSAIRAIRAHEAAVRGPHTPILAVSAHADSGALALKAGADLHLTKPVTAAAMLNAVVRALSQGSEKLGSQAA